MGYQSAEVSFRWPASGNLSHQRLPTGRSVISCHHHLSSSPPPLHHPVSSIQDTITTIPLQQYFCIITLAFYRKI